jgi:hypothetical protein
MGRPLIRGALAFVAASVVLAGGCAPESKLLREDPGFTAEALRQGGLVVLGVVQKDEIAQARKPLTDALERVLAGARPDVPITPYDRLRASFPDSAMRLFLLGYQMRGDPDAPLLEQAADSARRYARYGILTRVDATSVRYGTRSVPPTEGSGGAEVGVRVTGRDVRVEATVYDLSSLQVVYRGKFLGSSETAPSLRPPPRDTTDVDSLPPVKARPTWIDPSKGTFETPGPSDSPAEFGFPDAPPVARAAEGAFLTLARSLPGSPTAATPPR